MARAHRFHLALAASLCAVAGGCAVEAHGYREPGRAGGDLSIARRQHVCHADCDHVWTGTQWVDAGHWHRRGCGHVLVDDRWVDRDRGLASSSGVGHGGQSSDRSDAQHVCDRRCDHLWDGEQYRHGPGCGHAYVDGRWAPAPGEEHACGQDCRHVWDGEEWVSTAHQHRPGCEHELINGRWVEGDVELGHVCGGGCDHLWTGRSWIALPGHEHGVMCGHVIKKGRWVVGQGPRR